METVSVADALSWQAEHATRAGAPCTGRVIRALRAVRGSDTEVARRMNTWPGLALEAAMPLRIAGGIHNLHLTGDAPELAAVYSGAITDQDQIDRIVTALVVQHDGRLAPWLDGPPQTNEAGRSASIMGGLLTLSQTLGPRFELNEIGASAGVNTMIERYFYDLGGTRVGPEDSPMRIVPEWRGKAPQPGAIEIVAIRGSDIAPVDLTDPAEALRLKSFVWADAAERIERIDAAISLAREKRPDLVAQDAGEFVLELLDRPQQEGVTRTLYHSVMWQYLPVATRKLIREAMMVAGAKATRQRPLAWIKLETNRSTFAHELMVKSWPGGGEEWRVLGQAHPHGAWVEWFGG